MALGWINVISSLESNMNTQLGLENQKEIGTANFNYKGPASLH